MLITHTAVAASKLFLVPALLACLCICMGASICIIIIMTYFQACAPKWVFTNLGINVQPRGLCFSGHRNLTGFRAEQPCSELYMSVHSIFGVPGMQELDNLDERDGRRVNQKQHHGGICR